MSFLKTLTFTTADDLAPSPIEKKRHHLIAALKDQLVLLEQPDLTRTRKKWVQVDGERILTQKLVPVRPWWKQSLEGKVILTVRSGLRRIEFEKGKSAIAVSSMDELQKVIRGLIDAAQTGELDNLLSVKLEPQTAVRKRAA